MKSSTAMSTIIVFYRYICWEQRYKFSPIKTLNAPQEREGEVELVAALTYSLTRKHQHSNGDYRTKARDCLEVLP